MARHMKFGRVAVAETTMLVTSPHRTKRSSEILLSFSLRLGFYKFGRVAVAEIRMMGINPQKYVILNPFDLLTYPTAASLLPSSVTLG